LGAIQTNISGAPQISKASCLDIAIPGIFGVPIEVIVIYFQSKGCMSLKITRCFVSGSLFANQRTRLLYTTNFISGENKKPSVIIHYQDR
jgi:hypothetical protein